MAQDPRRLDDVVATIRSLRAQLDALQNTALNRIATHTHAGGGGGSGTVTSVTAADSTIVIGGTPTVAPTVKVGSIAESQVTNLTTDLAAKATDTAVVHLTGAETVAGVKTFSSAPVVPSASFPESAVTNLTTDLAAKAPLASPALTGTATAANLTVSGTLLGETAHICTSTTRPASPVAGQLILETDTQLFARYTGSVWVQFMSAGDATTVHEVEYTAASGQTITTVTDTPLSFPTAVYSSSDVTIGTSTTGTIANAKFTMNRGGLWQIDAGVRTAGVVTAKSYGIWLGPDGGTTRYAATFHTVGGTDAHEFTVSCTRRFTSGSAVNCYFWHNNGTTQATAVLNSSNHIRLSWLRS